MRRFRLTTATAAIGFAATGMAAAGWLDAFPEPVRALAVCAGVIVAPAVLTACLAAARTPLPPALLTVPLAVLVVLSAYALAFEAASHLGMRFAHLVDAVAFGLCAAFGFAFVAGRRLAVPPRRSPARGQVATALAVLILVGFAATLRPAPTVQQDAFDHIGYARRIIVSNELRPGDVLAMPVDAAQPIPADPRKGSVDALLAVVAELAACDPAVVWEWFPVVVYPTAALAFMAFSAAFVGTGPGLWACAGLFLLSYGGTGFAFASSAAHGEHLAILWYWVIAAVSLRTVTLGVTRLRVLSLVVLGAGGVFAHLGVALHVWVLAATLAIFGAAAGLARGPRGEVALALLTSTGLAALVRLAGQQGVANEIHAHVQGVLVVGERWWAASPIEVVRAHGMVFLGGLVLTPFLIGMRRVDGRARLALAFSLLPLALAFVPWLATPLFERAGYMVFRVLTNVPALAVVVLVVGWLARRQRAAWRRVLAGATLAAWALLFLDPSARAFVAEARMAAVRERASACDDRLADTARAFPTGSTILTDPATAYALSACASHRFVALYEQHANPYDPFALDRVRAVRDVLSPFAVADLAPAACRHYGVDFVLVNRNASPGGFLAPWSPDLYDATVRRLEAMPASFERVFANENAQGFRFRSGGAVERPAAVMIPPVVPDTSAVSSCAVDVPGGAFALTGAEISPRRVLPGDSVVVTLAYRKDVAGSFGFPFVIHLRFDHESVTASRSYPGEKYVRRARERRTGEFVRFRADVNAGHGRYDPDLWPLGVELRERFVVGVPEGARPGSFRLEVAIERESLLPNFHVVDLLYNRDHYTGPTCAVFEVVRSAVEQ